ncbi:MAG TPA: PKD domain-containing protein [Planctomycetota bacterium]
MRYSPFLRGYELFIPSALLLAMLCFSGSDLLAANGRLIAPSTSVSPNIAGAAATYSLRCKIKGGTAFGIDLGATVTYTFPAGTDASTITGVTFNGHAVSLADVTATATSISFPSPVALAKKSIMTAVLSGIRNPAAPGTYRASISVRNTSNGFDRGNGIFMYTIVAGTPQKLAFVVQPSNSAAGASIFPGVRVVVQDSLGNLVPTASVNISMAIGVNPASGTLSGTKTVKSINGVAVFGDLSIDQAGSGYTLVASAPALLSATSTSFNVFLSNNGHLSFIVQPTDIVAGAPITPAIQVQIRDHLGNLVPTATDLVTLAIGYNPGNGTLLGTVSANAVGGVATFSNVSIDKAAAGYTLEATAASLFGTTSSMFSVTASTPNKLGFVYQPSDTAAGDATLNPNPIFPDVQVAVEDAYGNVVSSAAATTVTIVIGNNPTGGLLSGVPTTVTSAGVADFTDLEISKVGNGYTLIASAPGLGSAESAPFNIFADYASQVGFTVQPSDTLRNAIISPAVQVALQDPLGNTDPTSTDSITISQSPVSGNLSGTLTVSTLDGVAVFSDLSLDTLGSYTLLANSLLYGTANSSSFSVILGPANHLAFSVQPTSTAAAAAISPAVQVSVLDAANNPVSSSALITVALGNNPTGAQLGGTLSVSATGGVATFQNLALTKAGQGYTLSASAAGLGSTNSTAFDISSAPALDHFAIGAIGPQVAGAAFGIQVTAQDAYNNTYDSFSGTVQITSNGTLVGSPVTSAAFVAGVLDDSVTITSAQASTTISVNDGAASGTSNSFAVTTAASGLDHFAIAPIGTQVAGAAFGVTVTAQDIYNNTMDSYSGSVQITSSGTLVGAPVTSAAFVAGVLNDSVAITSAQAGTTISVSDGAASGVSNSFAVTTAASGLDHFAIAPIGTQAAGSAFGITVAAQDIYNNTMDSYSGSVQITSSGTLVGAPVTSAPFVAGVLNDSVTITSAQASTTISVSDGAASGTSNSFAVTTAASGLDHFAIALIGTQAAGTAFGITVTAQDVYNNTMDSYSGSVQITSSGTLVGAPVTSAAFVAGVLNDSVTITSAEASTTISVSDGAASGTSNSFAVTTAASGLDHFAIAPIGTQAAGTAFGITVTAQDVYNNTVDSYSGSVQITSSGVLVGAPVTSASFMAGVLNDSVTITSAQAGTTISVNDGSASGTSNSFAVTTAASGLDHFAIAPIGTQAAGTAFGITVTAQDIYNNTMDSYSGSVQITSSGTLVGAPVNSAPFVAGVLNDSVTITSAQASTTISVNDGAASGTSNAFAVTTAASGLDHFAIAPIGTQAAGTPFGITVTAQDVYNNTMNSYSGSVQITSSGTLVGAPVTSAAFVAGVLNDSVTITSAQASTTLSVNDGSASGTSNSFAVTTATSGLDHFAIAPIGDQAAGTAFGITVTAQDVYNNTMDSYSGTVQITSSGTLVGAPVTSVAFVAGVLNDSVTITSAQASTTISVNDGAVSGTSNSFAVTTAASGLDHFAIAPIGDQVAGTPFGITVTAQDVYNNTLDTFSGSVEITSNGTLLNAPLTGAFNNGIMNQDITLTSAQNGTTVTVTEPVSGTQVSSDPFDVSVGARAKLAFVVQPGKTEAGAHISPAVKVAVQDAWGNTVPGADNEISLALGGSVGDGVLSGTVSALASSGVAGFSDLSIDKVGTGYALLATSAGLQSATSATFAVVDTTPPQIISPITINPPTGTAGQPSEFTVAASDAQPVTYTWDFGDGTSGTGSTVSHTFTSPGNYQVTVTVTDAGGLPTRAGVTYVVQPAPVTPPATPPVTPPVTPTVPTTPENPDPPTTPSTPNDPGTPTIVYLDLKVQKVSVKVALPSKGTDGMMLKGLVQLPDHFAPKGTAITWNIAGIQGGATFDARGNSLRSPTVKATLRYKKVKKGQSFTARPGKLMIRMSKQNLSALGLSGISGLNYNTRATHGDPAGMDTYVTLVGWGQYAKFGVAGTYRAKKDKFGLFSAKYK